MNALYNLALCPTSCSHSTPKHNTKWKTEVNGTATVALKGKALSRASSVTGKQRRIVSAASVTELTRVSETKGRQNIPTEKQLVDPFRQGIITEGGVRYRQTVVIRSYEVGADKTATLESILNLLQVNYLTETFCVFVKITESILKHFTLKFS
ncbi:oleoyl-acyl carrier protein thioesterase 1, chloroplastic [Populus trichocarpa]|jgi:fatty acyl-ACP thioesterase B|uniref:oleoyl-acyl carrier protein thioesterase 1, chloroplastic n=1 Tax=Populus trichocarpa TaxID=3694 RepID=UPI00227997C6|nr:oleoyl-acyl carrier protein thioesterase 1, chloroplastic [Populus trichocarpa]